MGAEGDVVIGVCGVDDGFAGLPSVAVGAGEDGVFTGDPVVGADGDVVVGVCGVDDGVAGLPSVAVGAGEGGVFMGDAVVGVEGAVVSSPPAFGEAVCVDSVGVPEDGDGCKSATVVGAGVAGDNVGPVSSVDVGFCVGTRGFEEVGEAGAVVESAGDDVGVTGIDEEGLVVGSGRDVGTKGVASGL